MTAFAVPQWLKTDNPIVYFEPEHLLFIPQRRIVWINGRPHLLDYAKRSYPYTGCREPRLEDLRGVLVFVPESEWKIITLIHQGDRWIADDGSRKWVLKRVSSPNEVDVSVIDYGNKSPTLGVLKRVASPNEVDVAAESLAEAFAGAVVDGSDYSPGGLEEFPALEVD